MIRLVEPSARFKTSFLAAVREFQREGRYRGFDREFVRKHFTTFVRRFKNRSRGIGLPRGIVPDTTFWLVDNSEFIGRVVVRHRLTSGLRMTGGHIGYEIRKSARRKGCGMAILKLVLPKARKIGLRRILVTCDASNTGSRKIIERNGGIFENKLRGPTGRMKLRYWIRL